MPTNLLRRLIDCFPLSSAAARKRRPNRYRPLVCEALEDRRVPAGVLLKVTQEAPFVEEGKTAVFNIERLSGMEHQFTFEFSLQGEITGRGQKADILGGDVRKATFLAGESVKRIEVAVRQDNTYELNEDLIFTMGIAREFKFKGGLQPVTYVDGKSTAVVEILNVDAAPVVTLENLRNRKAENPKLTVADEGDAINLEISLSRVSYKDTKFLVELEASAPTTTFTTEGLFGIADATLIPQGALKRFNTFGGFEATIEAGKLNTSIQIKLPKDKVVEAAEFFKVTVVSAGPDDITGNGAEHDVQINDLDVPVFMLRAKSGAKEVSVDEGTNLQSFTEAVAEVVLGSNVERDVSVSIKTIDGTATAFLKDYLPLSDVRFQFAIGHQAGAAQDVKVNIVADDAPEKDKKFYLQLIKDSRVRFEKDKVAVVIVDDDGPRAVDPEVTIELDQQAGSGKITVTLQQAAKQDTLIAFDFRASSQFQRFAVEGDDFQIAPNNQVVGRQVLIRRGEKTTADPIFVIGLTPPSLPGEPPPPMTGFAFTLLAGKGYRLKSGEAAVDVLTNLPPEVPEE